MLQSCLDVQSFKMWKKLPLKGAIYVSLGTNLVLTVFILIIRNYLPPVVPLFYGLPSGQSQLAPTLQLLMVPLVSVVITVLNIFIVSLLRDVFYKKALIISGVLISFLGAVTVIKIVFLVGFF